MSDGHDGVVQCHTFRHEITATPRHEIGSFGAKFIVSGTQFRYSRNENCTSRHQFGVFSWAQTTAKAQAYSLHATPAHVWPCQGLIASRSNSHAGE